MISYLTRAHDKLEGHLRQDNPHYKAQHQQRKATLDYSIIQQTLSLQSRDTTPAAPKEINRTAQEAWNDWCDRVGRSEAAMMWRNYRWQTENNLGLENMVETGTTSLSCLTVDSTRHA